MSRPHTHYDNLKVSRNAPPEVIRAAYKALSQRYHPDKNSSPDATRIMKILNEAYEVLGDAERRQRYDASLIDAEEQLRPAPCAEQQRNAEPSESEKDESDRAAEPQPTTSEVPPNSASTTGAKKRSGWYWIVGIVVAIFIRMVVGASHDSSNSETATPSQYTNGAGSDLSSNAPAAPSDAPVREEPKVITSFDCTKARSTSEKLICSDAELASLDLDLATVFAQAKSVAPDKRAFADTARRAWNWRNANCSNKSCLVTWYNEQRERLVAILNQPVDSAAASQPPIVNADVTTSGQSEVMASAQPVSNSPPAAPSSFYAERVKRRVRPNIIWAGEASGLETVVAVRLGRTGTLLSASVSRSSGNSQWDDAALRAVQRSDPMPVDVSGEAPASFTITLSPNGDSPALQSGRDKAIAWVHAIKVQHPDADAAYDSAARNLASIKASCPDAILLQQTPHRPSEYRPVTMFLSQQCRFIASYWPETNEEQISFDATMIENWRGYCSTGGAMQTTCVRGGGA